VISSPNLGFSQACASSSFNTYDVTFSFSPEAELNSTNQFILELSDGTGSFTNPTTLYTSDEGDVTVSPATFSFSFPTTIAGESYKLRIKSTSPATTSSGSLSFSAYYKVHDTQFSINNLVSTGVYCAGGSYLLTIDDPGNESNDSPLQYSSLTFNWFKETSETTSVFVTSGATLSVTEPGTYFVETNYGSCTSNSYSNRVIVEEVDPETEATINSSLGNPFCQSEGFTTLNTIIGKSYQWYKDGEEISGATNQSYVTNESGTYTVDIDLDDCVQNGAIDLQSNGFASSIDIPETNYLNTGETLFITVTTDANNPEFEWYLNDNIISGASTNNYEAIQIGNYKVVIRQTSGCISDREFIFTIIEPFPDVAKIPNLISPNGDGLNDTWVIPQEYVKGTITKVMILNSQRKIVFETSDYLNNWPENQLKFKDVNQIYYYIIITQDNKFKKGTITIIK